MTRELTPGANVALDGLSRVSIAVGWAPTGSAEIDSSAFLCGSNEKVLSDDHFVFYNAPKSPDGGVTFQPSAGMADELRQRFEVDLSALRADTEKIDFALTIHGGSVAFKALSRVVVRLLNPSSGSEVVRFEVPVSGMDETALILASLYRRNGQWKFRAVGQGFVGGLAPLATHYGVDVDDDRAPTPAPPPKPTVNLSKLTLEKRGQSVSLEKKSDQGFGEILFNLNWDQRPPQKTGFLSGLLGAKALDLDLGCLWELSGGYKGVVQALGECWGDYRREPYIRLLGDDRTGAVSAGETILINGDMINEIRRVLVFAFIYEGAPNWAAANGVATIKVPGNADIEVHLDNPESGQGMCAIALIENDRGRLKVTKEERYFRDHSKMDRAYGWGMRWAAGSKD